MDERELPQVITLMKYWSDDPPVHLLVKWVFSSEKKPEEKPHQPDEAELMALAARFGRPQR